MLGDIGFESDEHLSLVISNIANALVAGDASNLTANATILNDDIKPEIALVRFTVEGDLQDFFEEEFTEAMAIVLDIDPARIKILSTAAGSVIVVFSIEDAAGKIYLYLYIHFLYWNRKVEIDVLTPSYSPIFHSSSRILICSRCR